MGASAPNGASTGDISPILVGPCLVEDNTALGIDASGPTSPRQGAAKKNTFPLVILAEGTWGVWHGQPQCAKDHHLEAPKPRRWIVAIACCVPGLRLHATHGVTDLRYR